MKNLRSQAGRMLALCCLSVVVTLSSSLAERHNGPRPHSSGQDEESSGRILRVGPGRRYQAPSEAAVVLNRGDLVEIDAGTYTGDVAVWRHDNITLRGVGGVAHLTAAGRAAERKAIWVIKGDNVTVENVEFSGARVASRNGAGIRFEGSGLRIRNCYFHHNEMGILTGSNADSRIWIEASEFAGNTVDYHRHGRLGHNIYIGDIERFVLINSHVHDASIGHNVKSRARENFILYNRITDESAASSYLVDLPNGGRASIVGNLFRQRPDNDNQTLIAFAAENNRDDPGQSLHVVNNTAVNSAVQGVFVANHSGAWARLVNNLWVGNGRLLWGPGELSNNLQSAQPMFRDATGYDYRLLPDAAAIDAGTDPGRAEGFSLTPIYQYRHPRKIEPRHAVGALDIGAYEYRGP